MRDRERLTANGVELAYDDLGAPDAPPAVLLHALGEAAEDWADLAPRLVAAGHRVLAFDLRGHADSGRPGDYSSAVMADDVVAALDALGVRDAVLVGHSLGGGASVWPPTPSCLAPVVEDVCPPYDRDRPSRSGPRASSCPSTGRWSRRSPPSPASPTRPPGRRWARSPRRRCW